MKGGAVYVTGIEVVVEVPFKGDAGLFSVRPNPIAYLLHGGALTAMLYHSVIGMIRLNRPKCGVQSITGLRK